jgi:hypothetical protein
MERNEELAVNIEKLRIERAILDEEIENFAKDVSRCTVLLAKYKHKKISKQIRVKEEELLQQIRVWKKLEEEENRYEDALRHIW